MICRYIEYYLTKGIFYQNINEKRFIILNPFDKCNKNEFTLSELKEILKKENLNLSTIDRYKLYSPLKGGYIDIKSNGKYPLNYSLTLYLHLKEVNHDEYIEIDNKISDLESQLNIINNTCQNINLERQTSIGDYDLIYLYSSPIVKSVIGNNSYNEFNEQIDYRSEIQKIVNTIKNSKKQFNALFESANYDSFINSIRKYPKILHISSHGIIEDKKNNKKLFNLCLEDKGCLYTLNEERIREILKNEKMNLIDLVFIGACHSERLGKIFFESGVKNVICVQEMTKISDLGAQKFSQNFYEFLLQGDTIQDAFNKSKECFDDVTFNSELMECCCNHSHTNDCKFYAMKNNEKVCFHNEYHILNKKYKMCKIKVCECKYNEYHIHDKKCKFIKSLESNLIKENLFKIQEIDNGNKVKLCCCSPNIPHNESNKFLLFSKENKSIFQNLNNGNLILNDYCCTECDVFNNMKKIIKVIGRGIQTKEIIDRIDDKEKKNNFILIFGPKNSGKKTFAKSCTFYLFERKSIEKIEFINIDSIFHSYSREKLNNIFNKISLKKKNGDEISKNKLLIIISFPSNIVDESLLKCVKSVLKILSDNYNHYIYLLLIDCESDKNKFSNVFPEDEYCLIQMTPLSKKCGRILFKSIDFSNPNYEMLTEDEINSLLEQTEYYPRGIITLTRLLNESKRIEVLKSDLVNRTKIIENLKIEVITYFINKCKISKLLFLLAIMPKGFSEKQVDLILGENYKDIIKDNNLINVISSDTKENWYKIIEILIIQIIKCVSQKTKKKWIIKAVKMFSIFFQMLIVNNTNEEYYKKGIWKNFDIEIFDKSSNDFKIDKKINIIYLKKHRYNLECLFLNYQELIMNILNEEHNIEFKEYFEKILLYLPILYKLKNRKDECISLLYEYIELSQKFNLKKSEERLNRFLNNLNNSQDDSSFSPLSMIPHSFHKKYNKEYRTNSLKGINNSKLKRFYK